VAAGKAGDAGDKCAHVQALLLTQGQRTRQLPHGCLPDYNLRRKANAKRWMQCGISDFGTKHGT